MKLITTLILILTLCSCSGGGLNSGGVVTPGGDITQPTIQVTGTYCDASTTCGVSEEAMRDAVSFIDSMAETIQELVGDCTKVCIVFDQESGAYYDGRIHMSPGEYMYRNLLHEYTHHCHLSNKMDSWWLLETVAEGIEVHFGYEQIPETCSFDIYNVDYTTQRHFGHFLMSTYGTDIFYKIVNCGLLNEESIKNATGEEWETVISKWKGGN